jgi:hypothetical protein
MPQMLLWWQGGNSIFDIYQVESFLGIDILDTLFYPFTMSLLGNLFTTEIIMGHVTGSNGLFFFHATE